MLAGKGLLAGCFPSGRIGLCEEMIKSSPLQPLKTAFSCQYSKTLNGRFGSKVAWLELNKTLFFNSKTGPSAAYAV